MVQSVTSIASPAAAARPGGLGGVGGAAGAGGPSFLDVIRDSLQEANHLQKQADQAVEQLLTGGDVQPAEVLTAVQKADLTFRLMLQIRNKLVAAYQELKEVHV